MPIKSQHSPRKRRASALMQVAGQLPETSVEKSLEEFISKANETIVAVDDWGLSNGTGIDHAAELSAAKDRAADLQRQLQDAAVARDEALQRASTAETNLSLYQKQKGDGDKAIKKAIEQELETLRQKLATAEAEVARAKMTNPTGKTEVVDHSANKALEAQVATLNQEIATLRKNKAGDSDRLVRQLKNQIASLEKENQNKTVITTAAAAGTPWPKILLGAVAGLAIGLAAGYAFSGGSSNDTAETDTPGIAPIEDLDDSEIDIEIEPIKTIKAEPVKTLPTPEPEPAKVEPKTEPVPEPKPVTTVSTPAPEPVKAVPQKAKTTPVKTKTTKVKAKKVKAKSKAKAKRISKPATKKPAPSKKRKPKLIQAF